MNWSVDIAAFLTKVLLKSLNINSVRLLLSYTIKSTLLFEVSMNFVQL